MLRILQKEKHQQSTSQVLGAAVALLKRKITSLNFEDKIIERNIHEIEITKERNWRKRKIKVKKKWLMMDFSWLTPIGRMGFLFWTISPRKLTFVTGPNSKYTPSNFIDPFTSK